MHAGNLEKAIKLVRGARKVTVFTGAGISAESGIPTFRDTGGLWQEFPPERFAHWQGLLKEAWHHPELVARFVLGVIEPVARAVPNPAHHAITRLQQRITTTVITQNIDGLHQEAGTQDVREIHGSLFKLIDRSGTLVRTLHRADLQALAQHLQGMLHDNVTLLKLLASFRNVLGVDFKGIVRPNIVLFHDAMAEPDWQRAQQDAQWCELMIVVGTSAQVYPAAMIPHQAHQRGCPIIEINPVTGEFGGIFLKGKASEILPQVVQKAR